MLEEYKTVYEGGQGEIVEKKSRFIATVRPVQTEEEALIFIEEMRKKYWDATHNCFAYVIGERREIMRCSDDGEPGGTAGKPMLDVLLGEELYNTAVVVTRYFGGTLLGTGGLVRAYGKAAKEGLLAAGIAELVQYSRYFVTVDYTDSGKVQYEILQDGHVLHDTQYTDQVQFCVLVESEQSEAFEKKMLDIMKGKQVAEKMDEVFGVWQNETLQLMEQ